MATALVRFSDRICSEASFRERPGQERKGFLIYGAGAAGAELVREIHSNPSTRYSVKGFLDDDPLKQGAVILGVPVLGTGREASSVVRRLNRRQPAVEEIVIAMRSATSQQMREILANCHAARIPCKTLPRIDELLSGKVLTAHVRNLSVHDLLGRQPVKLDDAPVRASIAGPVGVDHRRRRLDRFGALPSGSPLRTVAPGGVRSSGKRALQDRR